MSQWTGTFSMQNTTGQTIYNLKVSHTASGCPDQTPITATHVSNNAWAGTGQWETETTSNDNWYWSYNSGSPTGPLITGSKQCNLEKSDTYCYVILTSTGAAIDPSSSGDCTGSNN